MYPYALPDLPYAPDALDTAIDAETMRIHHGRHHQGYTNNLNRALEAYPELQGQPLLELLGNVSALPEAIRLAVLNNGGGYLNHALFWPMMRPGGGGAPTGALADAIDQTFGSLDALKQRFKDAATGVFGSGWAWLARDGAGTLEVIQTTEQDPPHAFGFVPVLGVDVWEHAYYLRYQNRRGDYVDRWWSVVDWEQAARNYAA
ncbi:MAG: superoxide dismutase [Bacteroidota bacterium]